VGLFFILNLALVYASKDYYIIYINKLGKNKMEKKINTLLNAIKNDYSGRRQFVEPESQHFTEMTNRFNNSLGFKNGRKYIKITTENGGSVWGFIVNTDEDNKFKKGDILKPASWNTPARNQARGNILDGNYSISWTGPHYLK